MACPNWKSIITNFNGTPSMAAENENAIEILEDD
jgi:hypothetical protein